MRKNIESILTSIFSIGIMISIVGGAIIFLMYVAAVVLGGATGESMAVNASKVYMPYFIKAASIGTIAGLLLFYIKKDHLLSLENTTKNEGQRDRTHESVIM